MSRSRSPARPALELSGDMNPNYRTPDLHFQPKRLHRASLSGAIALLEALSTELRRSDPDSSIWYLAKVAAQKLRHIQAGGIVGEAEWIEAFVSAQDLFESIRAVTVIFQNQKRSTTNEQAVSRPN
jgi:hypothetical protein